MGPCKKKWEEAGQDIPRSQASSGGTGIQKNSMSHTLGIASNIKYSKGKWKNEKIFLLEAPLWTL